MSGPTASPRRDGPMRVLHVIDGLGFSGAETSLRQLLPSLEDAQLHHAVTTFRPVDVTPDSFVDAGIDVHSPHRPLTGRVARTRHVLRTIADVRPDLLHTTLFEADLAGRVAGILTRTPVLTSVVNTSYVPEARPTSPLSRLKFRGVMAVDGILARRATHAFHAITWAVAERTIADLRIDPSRIWVVPRGRSPRPFGEPSSERRRAVRSRMGLSQTAPVLLNVGRHEPQKGQMELIAAAATLIGAIPDLRLLIAGREGRSTSAIRRRIHVTGLGDVVELLGRRDDVGDLLAAADVFVFPSRYEGLGGAVLEAMMMRVPIVASDLPALREVLDDGRCGALVPLGDSKALAAAVERALSDSTRTSERTRNAKRRVDSCYSFEASLTGMRSMYMDIRAELRALSTSGRRVRPFG